MKEKETDCPNLQIRLKNAHQLKWKENHQIIIDTIQT